MEIYNESGKLKTPILRVSKSIGALLITSNQEFSQLSAEKITAHIERANGNNEEIATNISLKAFIATSVFGETSIRSNMNDGFSVLVDLANEGSLIMSEDETLVISLSGLRSTQNYTLNGIEMPVKSAENVFFTEKVLLAGQKNRKFDVTPFDEAFIDGDFSTVKLEYATDQGNSTIELTKKELRAISHEDGSLVYGTSDVINETTFSIVGVINLEIFTEMGMQITLVLRDIDKSSN
jgi:hypothetical protein